MLLQRSGQRPRNEKRGETEQGGREKTKKGVKKDKETRINLDYARMNYRL